MCGWAYESASTLLTCTTGILPSGNGDALNTDKSGLYHSNNDSENVPYSQLCVARLRPCEITLDIVSSDMVEEYKLWR